LGGLLQVDMLGLLFPFLVIGMVIGSAGAGLLYLSRRHPKKK
jgi:hypothetical protein